jgi:chaperonin GroES
MEVTYMATATAVQLRPLGDRVVVKPLEAEEKTKGGIILPDTAKDKPQEGEVVAVGPGRVLENGNRVALDVKVGDRVVYSKYGGTEVKIDDEEYLVIRESDLLAVRG